MSRVVMDSDDESDLDESAHHHEPGTTQLQTKADTEKEVSADNRRGTSSSEKLRKEINTAHSALLEPTPSRSKRSRPEPTEESSQADNHGTTMHDAILISTDGPESDQPPPPDAKLQESSPHDTILDESSRHAPESPQADPSASHKRTGKQDSDSNSDSQDRRKPSMSPLSDADAGSMPQEALQNTAVQQGVSSQYKQNPNPVVLVPSKDTDHTSEVGISAPKTRKRKADSELRQGEPQAEDVTGLPKETYIPRPTRSRGARSSPEPVAAVDSPKRRNSKRLKASADVYDPASDIKRLCEMGFTESLAETTLADAGGDFDKALEVLVRTNVTDSVQAPPGKSETPSRKTKRSRGRPKKSTATNVENESEESQSKQDAHPDNATVKNTVPVDKIEAASHDNSHVTDGTIIVDIPTNEDQAETATAGTGTHEALKDADANSRANKTPQENQDESLEECGDFENDNPAKGERNEKDEHALETEQQKPTNNTSAAVPTKPKTSASPEKPQSAVKSGKVALKVGLSKRARIEPLLKVVRK